MPFWSIIQAFKLKWVDIYQTSTTCKPCRSDHARYLIIIQIASYRTQRFNINRTNQTHSSLLDPPFGVERLENGTAAVERRTHSQPVRANNRNSERLWRGIEREQSPFCSFFGTAAVDAVYGYRAILPSRSVCCQDTREPSRRYRYWPLQLKSQILSEKL